MSVPYTIDDFRSHILGVLPDGDLTFITCGGNVGDYLIWEGTRQLLADRGFTEITLSEIEHTEGQVALITGSGGWCKTWPIIPQYLPQIEQRFEKVIVLPSSFDIRVKTVREALEKTKAKVFARELYSYQQIRDVCDAYVAYDCAFFFDFSEYRHPGEGTLNAYRLDPESAGGGSIPPDNTDISATCGSLDQWLRTIAHYNTVKTDRAHVMIAGAMLGKTVYYRSSNYHKVPGIAEYSLQDLPVYKDSSS